MLARLFILLLILTHAHFVWADAIVPDGATNTTVSTNSDGSLVVDIAPDSGNDTSYNTYTDFNIPDNEPNIDVYLNNSEQKVNTIINEVTSLNPSLIEGKLKVAGPQAYVIIVNPNGITVNGGSFVNTYGLALAAGKIFDPANGSKNYFIKTTDTGFINIGENGLSGEFNKLVLAAKKLKIEGKVENTKETSNGLIKIIAGENELEFDADIDIVGAKEWVKNNPVSGPDSDGMFLVDITNTGSLHASKMYIVVTDQGAGVKINGALGASVDEMKLTVDGHLLCEGAELYAKTNLTIEAGSFTAEDNTSILADSGTLNITTSKGDIINKGSNLTSGMYDDNREVKDADMLILNSAGKIVNESVSENNYSAIFSYYGNVVVTAVDDILNENGRIVANGFLKIKSIAGDFINKVFKEILPNEGVEEWYSKVKRFLFFKTTTKGFRIAYGDLKFKGQLDQVIGGTGVSIEADNAVNYGSNIRALQNDVVIKANSLVNEAALTGSVSYEIKKGFFMEQNSNGNIFIHGGRIIAGDTVSIELTDDLLNKGGTIMGGNNVSITADEVITEGLTTYTSVFLDRGFNGEWGKILRKDMGGDLTANRGYLKIHTRTPVISRGGTLSWVTEKDIPQGEDEQRKPIEENLSSGNIGMFF